MNCSFNLNFEQVNETNLCTIERISILFCNYISINIWPISTATDPNLNDEEIEVPQNKNLKLFCSKDLSTCMRARLWRVIYEIDLYIRCSFTFVSGLRPTMADRSSWSARVWPRTSLILFRRYTESWILWLWFCKEATFNRTPSSLWPLPHDEMQLRKSLTCDFHPNFVGIFRVKTNKLLEILRCCFDRAVLTS